MAICHRMPIFQGEGMLSIRFRLTWSLLRSVVATPTRKGPSTNPPKSLRGSCYDFDSELAQYIGEDDHLHLLVVYPPKVALWKLVNSLKGFSSRRLRKRRPEVRGRYWRSVLWSPSYFAASRSGAPLSIIAEYVRNQRQRDALPPRPRGRGFRAKN
jgi:REP element-mobilizing transposase RayT